MKTKLQLERENKFLRECLSKILDYELDSLNISWAEFEIHSDEIDYSPIITYAHEGLSYREDIK